MISAPLMTLVNQRLEVQEQVGIAWPQRNANDRQTLAQTDRINELLGRARCAKDTDGVTGARLLEDISNAAGEKPGPLPHQVNFHQAGPAVDKAATFAQVAVAFRRLQFVRRAKQLQHSDQPAGTV